MHVVLFSNGENEVQERHICWIYTVEINGLENNQ